jgi:hypothetical protein
VTDGKKPIGKLSPARSASRWSWIHQVLRMICARLVISTDAAVERSVVMLFASLPPYY